jgi:hypothetical protein
MSEVQINLHNNKSVREELERVFDKFSTYHTKNYVIEISMPK